MWSVSALLPARMVCQQVELEAGSGSDVWPGLRQSTCRYDAVRPVVLQVACVVGITLQPETGICVWHTLAPAFVCLFKDNNMLPLHLSAAAGCWPVAELLHQPHAWGAAGLAESRQPAHLAAACEAQQQRQQRHQGSATGVCRWGPRLCALVCCCGSSHSLQSTGMVVCAAVCREPRMVQVYPGTLCMMSWQFKVCAPWLYVICLG